MGTEPFGGGKQREQKGRETKEGLLAVGSVPLILSTVRSLSQTFSMTFTLVKSVDSSKHQVTDLSFMEKDENTEQNQKVVVED